MPARVLAVDPYRPAPAALDAAAEALRHGRLVVFPTETVYGWACRADDAGAVAALRAAKDREGAKPLTLHVAPRDEPASVTLLRATGPLPPPARRLAERGLPGPLTLVVRDRRGEWTGVRIPDHAVAAGVLARCPFPVAATSVNRSGEPPAVDGAAAAATANAASAVILDAGPAALAEASTVVRCGDGPVEILREGAVPAGAVAVLAARWVALGGGAAAPRRRAHDAAVGWLAARGHAPGQRGAGTGVHVILEVTPPPRGDGRRQGPRGYAAEYLRRMAPRRPFTPALLDHADRVWLLAAEARRAIVGAMPGIADRVLLLDPDGRDLPPGTLRKGTPAGGSRGAIEAAIEQRLASFLAEPDA